MKMLTEKKLILILIAACIVFVLFGNAGKNSETAEESVISGESVSTPATSLQEKLIYSCRLGEEEVPAVQISEMKDETEQTTHVVARVVGSSEVTALQTTPVWDYKSIAARSGDNLIEIAYAPDKNFEDYEWILTLADKETVFRERVRDCTEISDE